MSCVVQNLAFAKTEERKREKSGIRLGAGGRCADGIIEVFDG